MQLWLNPGPGLHQRWRDFGSEEKSPAQQKRSCCTGDGSSKFHSSHQPGSLFFAGSSSFSREMDAHCAATWVSNSDWPVFFPCHCNLKCRRDCRFISTVFYLVHVHIYKYCMAHKHVFTRLSSAWKVPLTGSFSATTRESHHSLAPLQPFQVWQRHPEWKRAWQKKILGRQLLRNTCFFSLKPSSYRRELVFFLFFRPGGTDG